MRKISLFASCALAFALAFASCGKISNKEVLITDMRLTYGGEALGDYLVTRVDSVSWVKVEVEPADATEALIWEFDTPEVADVYTAGDELGRTKSIIALTEGECYVKVSTESGLNKDFRVLSFANPIQVQGLSLDQKELKLKVGESGSLKAILHPEDAEGEVSWEILDETILDYDWEEQGEYLFSALKAGTTKVRATCEGFVAECTVTVVSTYVPVTKVTADEFYYGVEGERFEARLVFSPSNATNKAVDWEIEKPELVSVEGCVGGVTDLIARRSGRTKATYTIRDNGAKGTVTFVIASPTPPDGAVDLGYRYGDKPVFFHKYNLGSKAIHSPGDFYAWGDPAVHYEHAGNITFWKDGHQNGYTKENYRWYDSSKKIFTKYSGASGDTSLSLEDDPAHLELGGCWRMPNVADLFWLYKECSWVIDYDNLSYIVTSKVDGFQGQSITIPMTGYYEGTRYLGYGQLEGMSIYPFGTQLASANLHYNGDTTHSVETIETLYCDMITINSKLYDNRAMYTGGRWNGYTIRPVWQTGLSK